MKNIFMDSVCRSLLQSLFGGKTRNLTAAWTRRYLVGTLHQIERKFARVTRLGHVDHFEK